MRGAGQVPGGPPDSMEPREKFVWSFFERHNKNASVPPPSPPSTAAIVATWMRAPRTGCCVTGSDTSCGIPTHREGRSNNGRCARGSERNDDWTSSWKTTRTAIYAISFQGATRGSLARKQCDLTRRSGSSRWTLTIAPDRPRFALSSLLVFFLEASYRIITILRDIRRAPSGYISRFAVSILHLCKISRPFARSRDVNQEDESGAISARMHSAPPPPPPPPPPTCDTGIALSSVVTKILDPSRDRIRT